MPQIILFVLLLSALPTKGEAVEGFAVLKTKEGFEIVPHASDDATGLVPQPMKDGRHWWKWTSRREIAEKLVARQEEFRRTKGTKRSADGTESTTSTSERKKR